MFPADQDPANNSGVMDSFVEMQDFYIPRFPARPDELALDQKIAGRRGALRVDELAEAHHVHADVVVELGLVCRRALDDHGLADDGLLARRPAERDRRPVPVLAPSGPVALKDA